MSKWNKEDFDEDNKKVMLIKDIVQEGFNVPDYKEYTDIYVDLDSVLSIMLANRLPKFNSNRDLIVVEVVNILATFLEKFRAESEIHLYYSFKPTKFFNKYIKNWNLKRNMRLDDDLPLKIIMKNIISKLTKIKIININLIECKDSPILYILRDSKLDGLKGEDKLIISRDPHYMCIFVHLPLVDLYNGITIMDRQVYRKHDKYPDLPYQLLPYYYLISGMRRNDYLGFDKWGLKKTEKYLRENYQNVLTGEDEMIKDFYDKELKVFTLDFPDLFNRVQQEDEEDIEEDYENGEE